STSPRRRQGAGPCSARDGRSERRDRLRRGADCRALGLQGRPRYRGHSSRAAAGRRRRSAVLDAGGGLRAPGGARPEGRRSEWLHRRRPNRARLWRGTEPSWLGLVPLGGAAEPAFPRRLVVALGASADDDLLWLAALEEDDRRDREDVVAGLRLQVLVHVHLEKPDALAVLLGEVVDDRADNAARPAPGRPKVDHHGLLRIEDFGLKVGVGDVAHHAPTIAMTTDDSGR